MRSPDRRPPGSASRNNEHADIPIRPNTYQCVYSRTLASAEQDAKQCSVRESPSEGKYGSNQQALVFFKARKDSLHAQKRKRDIRNCVSKWSVMVPDAATASARLLALIAATKHKAQDLQRLIARYVLQYGMPFVHRVCEQLAQLLQYMSRTTRAWTVGSPWQHLDLTSTRLAADRLANRALASTVLALNSTALKMAIRQLITITLSRGQDGVPGQAYTLHLRLLGGLIW